MTGLLEWHPTSWSWLCQDAACKRSGVVPAQGFSATADVTALLIAERWAEAHNRETGHVTVVSGSGNPDRTVTQYGPECERHGETRRDKDGVCWLCWADAQEWAERQSTEVPASVTYPADSEGRALKDDGEPVEWN